MAFEIVNVVGSFDELFAIGHFLTGKATKASSDSERFKSRWGQIEVGNCAVEIPRTRRNSVGSVSPAWTAWRPRSESLTMPARAAISSRRPMSAWARMARLIRRSTGTRISASMTRPR